MISIKGLDKADVLAALVNAARPLGLGFLQDDGQEMTKADAEQWIGVGQTHDDPGVSALRGRSLRFDYVKGRPIKVDLSGDEFDPRLYDRDQGPGAAARAIERLRARSTAAEAAP